ncbi:biopolymer transporter ExbD [Nitrosovibrio sp. Nv17]|jgi:biopolymer transport protein ExbD|uniref:ExbD/TolR family protein n=1 Tax=Nitrosovibrio sp. Nv17 TaxID=1855339 RepID=UPI00090887D5|nr:biopolymer transporter ExbD [Nitrosovibrio sp. Nv17]SFW28853.1 biopolymer transport protein ExbD [Nitrosovibrio sp. Nv17]
MNFQRGRHREEPEINLVPMIDVLLVILIFLMITTTYSRFSQLEIHLPQAASGEPAGNARIIEVSVDAAGRYAIDRAPIEHPDAALLGEALRAAAQGRLDPMIAIHADARATHQSVVTVMEAARMAGYNRITFTTENSR